MALIRGLSSFAEAQAKARERHSITGGSYNFGQIPGTSEYYVSRDLTPAEQNIISGKSSSGGSGSGSGTDFSSLYNTNTSSSSSGGRAITEQEALKLGLDWNNLPSGYSRVENAANPSDPNAFLQQIKDELAKTAQDLADKTKKFETDNPFSFDEVQARSIAEGNFNPYYSAELKDFMTGVNAQRSTLNGEKSLLTDLNRIQTQQDQTKLNETIRASEEGYAGSGLFFSGARQRDTGLANSAGNLQSQARQDVFNQNILSNANQTAALGAKESQGTRGLQTQQTTDIENEINRMRGEAQKAYSYKEAQYLGYPYTSATGVQNGLMSLLQGFNTYG